MAKYNAARDAYDFALREQGRTTDMIQTAVSPEAASRLFVIHGRDSRLRSPKRQASERLVEYVKQAAQAESMQLKKLAPVSESLQ